MSDVTKELKKSQRRLSQLAKQIGDSVATDEPEPSGTPKTLEEVERETSAGLIAACKAKIARGEKPARDEIRAWQVEEASLTVSYGDKYIESLPQKTYIGWAQTSARQINSQGAEFGIPLQGGNKGIDLRAIVKRFHELLKDQSLTNQSRGANGPEESESIERRRCAVADLAEDERDIRRGMLIPRDECRRVHTLWERMLRDAGEALGRKHGGDAQDILNEALDDCAELIAQHFGVEELG